MSTPSTVNVETLRQIDRLAPASLTFEGKSYKRAKLSLYDNATETVRVDYTRKPRGAFLASKVVFSVRYVAASDLYDVTVEHFDGETFASTWLGTTEGATFEVFERFAYLARPVAA